LGWKYGCINSLADRERAILETQAAETQSRNRGYVTDTGTRGTYLREVVSKPKVR
jgi:hypothetical protein